MNDSDYHLARTSFLAAIGKAGSQTALAKICECTPGNISQLIQKQRPLSARFVLKVEAATGFSRYDLRPDIYPRENDPQQNSPVPLGRNGTGQETRLPDATFGGGTLVSPGTRPNPRMERQPKRDQGVTVDRLIGEAAS